MRNIFLEEDKLNNVEYILEIQETTKNYVEKEEGWHRMPLYLTDPV